MVAELVCEADHSVDRNAIRMAAHGLMICDGCVTGMSRDLREIPGLYAELITEAVSGTGPSVEVGGFVTGTRAGSLHPALKYNSGAADAANQIKHDFEWFYSRMRRDREGVKAVARLDVVFKWMLREVYWIAGSSYAVDFRNVVRGDVGHAVAILDPAGRPVDVGSCIEVVGGVACTGVVRKHGDGGKSRLSCDTCGFRVPVRSWGKYGERVARTKTVEVKLKGVL